MAAGSLEECVRLLKGSSDEQRLVGLLLATKFVSGDNVEAVRQVFDAVGMQFINRLLKTGQIQNTNEEKGQQQQAYLQLALTVLAAFSRLPEISSTDDFIDEVPVLLETVANKTLETSFGDCYECLLSICAGSERGLVAVYKAQTLGVVVKNLCHASSDAAWLQVAMALLSFLVRFYPNRSELTAHAEDLVPLVPFVAKQLGLQQDLRKFEALGLLRTLLTSDFSMPMMAALRDQSESDWTTYVRSGLGQILPSRVVAEQKQAALEVAEAVVELVGDSWLLGPMILPQEGKAAPRFRFFRIVVEALRVETEVVLNEVAKTLFETGDSAFQPSPENAQKLHALATHYALLERVINIISEEAAEGTQLSESLLEKTVTSLNEIVGVVLQLLETAQEHGQSCGDILLASVRLLGRYLGEAPAAHNQRVLKLLGYLLSVTTEGEERPLHAVSFMLPSLTLMTMDVEGSNALVSCKAHKQVVGFLQTAVEAVENAPGGIIVGASDVLLNLFVKKGELSARLVPQDFIPVLPAVAAWAGRSTSNMEVALAGAVSLLVLSLTTEREIEKNPGTLPAGVLDSVIKLIAGNVEACVQAEDAPESADEEDLWDITVSGCASCMERYPSLRRAILCTPGIQARITSRDMNPNEMETSKPALQLLLASLTGT